MEIIISKCEQLAETTSTAFIYVCIYIYMLDDYIDVLEVFVKHRYIQTPALKQMFIRWLANEVTKCCTIHKYLAK